MIQTMDELNQFFQSREHLGIKPGLERTKFLLNSLGNPEMKNKTVHVAGTNGKGSTIQFMESSLRANSYHVGVFTSPSFSGIGGHFLINGEEVHSDEIIKKFNKLLPAIQKLDLKDSPTNFEILTVLSFLIFANNVDVAIIETGMGGRYDTTNCFIPTVSVITNVAIDHTNFLGDSITEIAYHKAGIIKQDRPVVLGKMEENVLAVMIKEADLLRADVYQFGREYTYESLEKNFLSFQSNGITTPPIKLHMTGEHQKHNAAVAMMALKLLAQEGLQQHINKTILGIGKCQLPGRFEVIHSNPMIILDSAHNVAGVQALLKTIETNYPNQEKQLLFAGFKDKQLNTMLELLDDNIFSKIHLTTFDHERASILQELTSIPLQTPHAYIRKWQQIMTKFTSANDLNTIYFITGSLHFITLVRKFLVK